MFNERLQHHTKQKITHSGTSNIGNNSSQQAFPSLILTLLDKYRLYRKQ
jgi:hypothetical protein